MFRSEIIKCSQIDVMIEAPKAGFHDWIVLAGGVIIKQQSENSREEAEFFANQYVDAMVKANKK